MIALVAGDTVVLASRGVKAILMLKPFMGNVAFSRDVITQANPNALPS